MGLFIGKDWDSTATDAHRAVSCLSDEGLVTSDNLPTPERKSSKTSNRRPQTIPRDRK
jgi:hypothetical protein